MKLSNIILGETFTGTYIRMIIWFFVLKTGYYVVTEYEPPTSPPTQQELFDAQILNQQYEARIKLEAEMDEAVELHHKEAYTADVPDVYVTKSGVRFTSEYSCPYDPAGYYMNALCSTTRKIID